MSYGFLMGFAQAKDLSEAMNLALEYVGMRMEPKFHMRSDKHICTIFDIPFYSYGDAALCVYELVNTKKQ